MTIMVKSSMTYARHIDCMEGWEICRSVVLRGKAAGEKPLGSLFEDGEDNNKSDLKEIWCQTVDLTCLT